jgi:hypothetical protein
LEHAENQGRSEGRRRCRRQAVTAILNLRGRIVARFLAVSQIIHMPDWFVRSGLPSGGQFGMPRTIGKGYAFGNHNLGPATDAFVDAKLFVGFPVHRHDALNSPARHVRQYTQRQTRKMYFQLFIGGTELPAAADVVEEVRRAALLSGQIPDITVQ